ncbi:hypothetical protein [Streptantibioticus silvisoli]|uniref:DUF2267 domain-containing protein n=1 Tax=Streptantibioticus silvisoli TaxID=2705255 RepID=A0ABT6W240_9ACTN|nr:hypothetical protein [Streptantibioticus silvisoli]MDI5964813.1 hypothetical protein [Streptantibioticus silvisoli]
MDDREVTTRVIGILTRHLGWVGREDVEAVKAEAGALPLAAELYQGMFPALNVPTDATPADIARAVYEGAAPAFGTVVAKFCEVFFRLAEVHDAGHSSMTTADLLQELAVQAQES